LIFVACLLSLIGCGPASDRVLEQTVEQSYKIEPTTSISIKNVDGSIQVYGSPAHEMTLQAIKRAYSAKRLKQIAVDVSVQPGTVSIQTKIADRNAWAFLPSDAAFHLIAETVQGKIASDFTAVGEHRAQATTNVDLLVNDGGEAEIRMRATEGNIKVVEQNR